MWNIFLLGSTHLWVSILWVLVPSIISREETFDFRVTILLVRNRKVSETYLVRRISKKSNLGKFPDLHLLIITSIQSTNWWHLRAECHGFLPQYRSLFCVKRLPLQINTKVDVIVNGSTRDTFNKYEWILLMLMEYLMERVGTVQNIADVSYRYSRSTARSVARDVRLSRIEAVRYWNKNTGCQKKLGLIM